MYKTRVILAFCRCLSLFSTIKNLKVAGVKKIFKLLPGVLLVSLLFYCSDEGLSPDQREYIIPEQNISYYDDLRPMLEGKCGFECHSGNPEVPEIPFLDKIDFIEYPIAPGEILVDTLIHKIAPERAPLYKIITEIEPYIGIETMPPFPRSPLTDNQINGIKQWIAEGAPD